MPETNGPTSRSSKFRGEFPPHETRHRFVLLGRRGSCRTDRAQGSSLFAALTREDVSKRRRAQRNMLQLAFDQNVPWRARLAPAPSRLRMPSSAQRVRSVRRTAEALRPELEQIAVAPLGSNHAAGRGDASRSSASTPALRSA